MKALIITCEHGGNQIPHAYQTLFMEKREVLKSHKGYDLGALDLFQFLTEHIDHTFALSSTTSRLLIELNRSLHHTQLFSPFTLLLDQKEKQLIIEQYYLPYRNKVEHEVSRLINQSYQVLHLSVHSFTPILNGRIRTADIGLLYDPKKELEKSWAMEWKQHINALNPRFKVRMNYPYLGTADGLTTYLRKKYPKGYLGVELEVNQKFSKHNTMDMEIKKVLTETLSNWVKP
ncbi:N-formylglutamate amidohydrolase [Limibacter armeniacum]|uniref:N-formylglutamate amidohydrolase n=1 Tax=Limibacter armeniacum TaxID=466084 RepID=UPI002FE5CE80